MSYKRVSKRIERNTTNSTISPVPQRIHGLPLRHHARSGSLRGDLSKCSGNRNGASGQTRHARRFPSVGKRGCSSSGFSCDPKSRKGVQVNACCVSRVFDVVSMAFLEDQTEAVAVSSESAALKECLNGLPTDKRLLVTLRYESGASFDSISNQFPD